MKHLQDLLLAAEQEKTRQADKIKMLQASAAQESENARAAHEATAKEAAERLAAELKTAQGLQAFAATGSDIQPILFTRHLIGG